MEWPKDFPFYANAVTDFGCLGQHLGVKPCTGVFYAVDQIGNGTAPIFMGSRVRQGVWVQARLFEQFCSRFTDLR